MKKLIYIALLLPLTAMATGGSHGQQNGGTTASVNTSQNTNINVHTSAAAGAYSKSIAGASSNAIGGNSSAQGGSANNGGQSVSFTQPNQVASQGAVVAMPSNSQLSCDGTVGGAVNTPFSGLTAIWGNTDSTCPFMQVYERLVKMGLEHEACLVIAQYSKDQEINFNNVMCANVHNTNLIRN
jgi:hypothetical protein